MSEVIGIGNDIIEIARIRQSIERHGLHFLNRLFTQKEQDYCYKFQDQIPHFAGLFAAKEAIAKALGTGFGEHLAWLDIEILNDALGKPIAHLSHEKEIQFKRPKEVLEILVSISHSTDHATAVAITMKKGEGN